LPSGSQTTRRKPEFACALLSNEHPAVRKVPLAPVLGDPVNLLWYLPISEAERNRATEKGAAASLAEMASAIASL
jgi:hypothetical protein